MVQLPGVSLHLAEGQAPYIVNFSVPGIRSEIMLHHLEQLGIYVSSGSACSKGARSSVLAALGLPNSQIDSAIRVSMSGQTTLSELDRLLQGVRQGIDTLTR